MCGAFYPNYFEQVTGDEATADREMSGYNPCTTVMVCTLGHLLIFKCQAMKLGIVFGHCWWGRLTRVVPDKFHRAVKRLCVCVCVVGQEEGHLACKKLSGGMLAWLSVWGMVQICIWLT